MCVIYSDPQDFCTGGLWRTLDPETIVVNDYYTSGERETRGNYLVKNGGIVDLHGGRNVIFVEDGGVVRSTGGRSTTYLKDGAHFESARGRQTIYYEPLAVITDAGGSPELHAVEGICATGKQT